MGEPRKLAGFRSCGRYLLDPVPRHYSQVAEQLTDGPISTRLATITKYFSFDSHFSDGWSWPHFRTVAIVDFLETWEKKDTEEERHGIGMDDNA